MAVQMFVRFDAAKFKKGIDQAAEGYSLAFKTALNMAASMMREQMTTDVTTAGNYPADAVNVNVTPKTISIRIDLPGAKLLETGGTIQGNPLLWLPLSGTDAVGTQAKEYPGGLFSIKRKSGVPLLFSVADRKPRYFGTPSVKVAQKFHIGEIRQRVMDQLPNLFNKALAEANKNGGA